MLWGLDRRSVVSGNIFNSKGVHVGVVNGLSIFDLAGKKLFNLKGTNIYRLSGELVGHLSGTQGTEKRLDRSTDKLFAPKAVLMSERNERTTVTEIKVPAITDAKLSIGRWFKREGDSITIEEPLVEIDTDNVTHEIRAPATGILSKILVRDGGTVEPGTVVGMINQV